MIVIKKMGHQNYERSDKKKEVKKDLSVGYFFFLFIQIEAIDMIATKPTTV